MNIGNSADVINPVMEQNIKKEPIRVFKGKTEFTLDYSTPETLLASKTERHFYQRMLRAYLKGMEYFNFGFHYDKALRMRVPTEHKVDFDWE